MQILTCTFYCTFMYVTMYNLTALCLTEEHTTLSNYLVCTCEETVKTSTVTCTTRVSVLSE